MFKCSFCESNTSEPKQYLSHIQLCHSELKKFPCGFKLCLRTYTTLGSLRNHVYAKHKMKNVKAATEKSKHSDKSMKDYLHLPMSEGECSSTNAHNVVELEGGSGDPETEGQPCHSIPSASPPIEIDPAILFAAKLYDYPDLARIRTNQIINETSDILNHVIEKIKNDVFKVVGSENDTPKMMADLKDVFKAHEDPFHNLKTEYNCFKVFENCGTYIPPESYLLGERDDFRLEDAAQQFERHPVTAQMIKLRSVLQNFFEMPQILEETMNYVLLLKEDSTIISNFIQGELWRKLSTNDGDKMVLPLEIYFDEYENNNVLGSHRGISKCSAIYARILCLPPYLASKLENIFLFALFNTLDRRYFQDRIIISKIKDELLFLENVGITINFPGGKRKIFFRLALISGDNLGVHYMLGFRECFSQNKFCRFCLIDKQDINSIFHESQCDLRLESNYESDLKREDKENIGMAGECLFYGVGGFHPLINFYVDVTHDLLEGICRYDLGLILHYFIKMKKYVTLKQLNNRLKGFNYGFIKNKPAEILNSHLLKKHIIMSASEMLALVRYLPLIIGHLVPSDDEVWTLLMHLQDLINMLSSHDLPSSSHEILDVKITEYLKLLHFIFPCSFKPKHHLLVHYPRVLFLCGPLCKISTMRCEGKHREGRITSQVSISRVNVFKTICIKNQLRFNYRSLRKQRDPEVDYDKNSVKNVELMNLNGIFNFQNSTALANKSLDTPVEVIKKMKFNGVEIRKRSIIMMPAPHGPVFYDVEYLILDKIYDCILIVKKLDDVLLNDHTKCYEVINSVYSWCTLVKDDLYGCSVTNLVRTPTGKFIVKNWW